MITCDEFIKSECHVWGEDYIFDLIERGYTPKLTNHGWRWFYIPNSTNVNQKPQESPLTQVALSGSLCYAASVGVE